MPPQVAALKLDESSRLNQARAARHWRSTVRGAIPMISAISSTERPPKKRSSAIRALLWSMWASARETTPRQRLCSWRRWNRESGF